MRDEGTRNDGFRRFACRCIFGYLMTEMIAQDPLSQHLVKQVREFRQRADQLAQFLGRAPSGEELRQALGYPDEKRFQLLEDLANYHVNVESLGPEEGGDEDQEGIEDWNVTQRTAASAGRNALNSNPPYEATVLHLFQEQLQAAIGELPPLEQQLIQVHYYQEETLSQISRDIGISRQTLSKHHQRALAHLNETLTERGLGEESLPEVWEVDLV
jgi:RNA polymerase sigma factor (sigma-70 family)